MKKKLTILFMAFCIFFVSTEAKATIYGGKWVSNPTYYISSSNPYYSEFISAVNSWNTCLNNIGAPIQIMSQTATGARMTIHVDYYGNTGWNGYCEPGPNLYSGTYTYATYELNRTYMDSFTSAKRKAIAAHELGHALGLAHNDNLSTSPTLMHRDGSTVYYDSWGISTPQSYDIADLKSIY